MKRLLYSCVLALCLTVAQSNVSYAATEGWTDTPKFENFQVGQRLIIQVRDVFLNSTEKEIFRFQYDGKEYENINGKNHVVVSDGDNLTKKQLITNALTKHNELESELAKKEKRTPVLTDLSNLNMDNYSVELSKNAYFDANGVLRIKSTGSIYATILDKANNKNYIYFMEAAEGLKRIAGQTRIDTVLELAKATFKGKLRNVIITSSQGYADALSGSVFAYKLEAPILLLGNSDEDVQKVIAYMKENADLDGNIYILGGYGAVSKDVETKVKDSGFENIKRLGGTDRFGTNGRIVDNLNVEEGTPVVIASGENFADALSMSSIASGKQYPILLVKNDEVPQDVQKRLATIKPSKVFVIGKEGAVSEDVQAEITKLTSLDTSSIIRIGGANRYETSLEIAKYFDIQGRTSVFTSGENFPDALAGSVYAAKMSAPVILVNQKLTEGAKKYVKSNKFVNITIFGGEGAVNKTIEEELAEIFKQVSSIIIKREEIGKVSIEGKSKMIDEIEIKIQ